MKFLECRIPPPLVMVSFMVLVWLFDSQTSTVIWIQGVSAALAIFGIVIARSSIVGFLKAKTTVNPLQPQTATKLVVDGMFKYTRNPMYLAMAAWLMAWSLLFVEFWSLVPVVGFMSFITRFQILPEERSLITLFGDDYSQYKTQVRRWL